MTCTDEQEGPGTTHATDEVRHTPAIGATEEHEGTRRRPAIRPWGLAWPTGTSGDGW